MGLPEFEVGGEDIINQVVEVVSLDESLALVAGVHGCPAELVLRRLPLHETPDRLPHYRYRLHVWPKYSSSTSRLINLNHFMKELTCEGDKHMASWNLKTLTVCTYLAICMGNYFNVHTSLLFPWLCLKTSKFLYFQCEAR